MKRALLLQLPPPSFRWPSLDPNLPLAAGYLAAWCAPRLPEWEVLVPGWETADLLGDSALFTHLLAQGPDIVGLSLYGWNTERSLALADRLKRAGVGLVFGGPEVGADSPFLAEAAALGVVIQGEGEEAFRQVLSAGVGYGTAPTPGPEVDLSDLASPYLERCISPYPDGTMWLETVRGCPFRCTYCNYGKGAPRPRTFPTGWLRQHLEWAGRHDVTEVYLMDPSFNVRPDWESTLQTLENTPTDAQLRFHTELVADLLRPGDAARLAAAGLRSCELGLQSIHPEVLARVGRGWDEDRWRKGVSELLAADIETTVGLILGLPGDSPSGFRASVTYLLEHVPAAEIQVFPLACLPGTALRRTAADDGLRHLDRPPYTVERSDGFSRDDLRECLDWFEETTGLEMDPVDQPDLSGLWSGGTEAAYCSGVLLHTEAAAESVEAWLPRLIRRAARNLTLWCKGWHHDLPRWVTALIEELPHGVLSVVIDDGAGWEPDRLARLLATGSGRHYLDRSHGLLYGAGARLVPRLAVLVDHDHREATEAWQAAVRRRAELIWRLPADRHWPQAARRLAGEGETVFVQGLVQPEALPPLAAALGPEARGVVFESAHMQELWQELSGRGGFRVPEHRVTLP